MARQHRRWVDSLIARVSMFLPVRPYCLTKQRLGWGPGWFQSQEASHNLRQLWQRMC